MADDVSLGLSFYAQGGVADLRHETLDPALGADTPQALQGAGVRLESDGHMAGGGLQGVLVYERVRFGAEVAAYALMGVDRHVGPLPDGFSAEIGDPLGVRWATFVGYEVLAGPIYPYVDLRLSVAGAFASVALASDALGDLGTTSYSYFEVGLGPRAGVVVPVTSWAAVDVSAYHPIIGGHERLTFNAGLSLWCNQRSDRHASKMRRMR